VGTLRLYGSDDCDMPFLQNTSYTTLNIFDEKHLMSQKAAFIQFDGISGINTKQPKNQLIQ